MPPAETVVVPVRSISLTPAQDLLWAGQRLAPDAPISNMATVTHIGGPIDPARFVEAFTAVVQASDSLRTIVRDRRGSPEAAVLSEPPTTTQIVTLAGDDVRADEELDEWLTTRVQQPIDLSRCGYDSVLLRRSGDRWSWYLGLHHVITDAASSALVYQATAAAYAGQPVEVGSHRAHHRRQRDRQATRSWQRAHEHWSASRPEADTTSLYGPTGAFCTESVRRPVPFDASRRRAFEEALGGPLATLSPDLSRLAAIATATAVYVHRLGAGSTIRIGVPVHHRIDDETRSLVGPLMELYPITVAIAADDRLLDVHQRVVRECVTMLRRAEPASGPRPDFDVVCNVVTASFGPFGAIPAVTEWLHSGHVDPAHRLRVQAYDFTGAGELQLALDLNRAVADERTAARAPGHFLAVLDALVDDPEASIGSFPLIGDEERAILDRYNGRADEGAVDRPVDVVGALRRGEPRLALVEGERELDATALANRIDAVASWLVEQSIGPGDRVAVAMARSAEAVIALHAVLRAGAAFTPIDPELPAARRKEILDDLEPALVLDRLPTEPGRTVERFPQPDLDDLAYVLFTSGSTGRPKGVPVTHRGLAEYLRFATEAYVGPTPPVAALHSSLSFDLTVTTLFVPLLGGGRIVVFGEEGAPGLAAMARAPEITWLKATPSHLEILERLDDPQARLSTLVVGGEAFPRSLAERLREQFAGVAIFNEYGPTEAVVGCMLHRYDPATPGLDVPIGRPAPGVELHVFDAYGQPAPIGASGELAIGRRGMPSGYWRRPDLDAEAFVAHPAGGRTRLYRSGDRVRFVTDDCLSFEGRMDQQLKVGGIRLEPGEIEAALVDHPAVVRSAVGLWRPDARHDHGPACRRCGLTDQVPGVVLGENGICSVCRDFDAVAPLAEEYFGDLDELTAIVEGARGARDHDCLHLLSGGKDSTYALYRLVDLGFRVRALTLDNGFISDEAKANVRRVVADLDVEHEFVTTEAMNDVFRDSLERYANVCNGCFKVLYTLAVHRADELDIPFVVTGLSRGQFFETRLTPAQFGRDGFAPDAIDATVLAARKAYHREDDAVSRLLDVSLFETDDVFERIRFLDFYRYTDVSLDEMLVYLEERAPWIRPSDTGRSTNCLVNAAGIHVHRLERGFHNYALPYSWDVRLGHKTRDEALAELDDPPVPDEVAAMLEEIGYRPRPPEILTAWYEADHDVDPAELRARVARRLPDHAVPAAFVRVDQLPLSDHGKVDMRRLPAPGRAHRSDDGVPPETATELIVAEHWARLLSVDGVSATTTFFDLGGTSLLALEMIVAVSDAVGVELPETLAFRHRTVRDLAIAIDGFLADTISDPASIGIVEVDGPDVDSAATMHAGDMSVGEEVLWAFDRANPGDTRYNVTRLYRVPIPFDRDRLEAAVRHVVAQHAPLHTTFGDRRSLAPDDALAVERVRVAGPEALSRWADELKTRPFDIVEGPLVRLGMADVADGDQAAVLIGMPHIVVDAESLDRFWEQVADTYAGHPSPSPSITYAALGDRQRRRAEHDPGDQNFWARYLGDRPAPALAVDAPVPAEPDGYLERHVDLTRSELGHGPGRTPFTTALAAFAVAMDRRGWTEEIAVTASVRDADAADVIGYFLNPLPLFVGSDGDSSFAATARRADEAVADTLPHRMYPFAWMVRDARRTGRRPPTAEVMLAFEDLAPASLDGTPVTHEILASGTSVAAVTGFVQMRGDRVTLGVEYDGARIGVAAAAALLDDFAAILEQGVADPDQRTIGLGFPAVAQGGPTPDHGLIPELVRAQNETRPAMRSGNESLSYGDLGRRARQIADRLAAAGVGRGDRVALLLESSVDAVAAIVATWSIGAAYVPIGPDQPAARVAAMLDAVDARAVVRQNESAPTVPGRRPEVVLDCDTLDAHADTADRGGDGAPVAVDGDDAAYVIFTSGSTGGPKPVTVTHANLAASTAARAVFYPSAPERFLVPSPLSFDSSMVGLWWTLSTGGEVVVPAPEEVGNVDALVQVCRAHRISHLLTVPTLYRAMLRRAGDGAMDSLQTVIVAGEACPSTLVAEHHARLKAALVNEYGPTEATVWATAHRCDRDEAAPVPIGGPVAGMTAGVFGPAGRPLGLGAAGELWLAGPGVTRPAHTGDHRFVHRNGQRWYRTGDRVRLDRADGPFRFLGRIDDQLSVNGRRVEPGEIEQALAALPGIRQAAVGVTGEVGAQELVAVVEADRDCSPSDIRRQLRADLPSVLIPRRVSVVAALPRTRHGKIDRSAVPWPEAQMARAVVVAADVETTMVEAWRYVFADPTIGPDSDFFELGGDSLTAVGLAVRLEQQLDRPVPINLLIDARTPAALAQRLDEDPNDGLLVPLRPAGSRAPLVVISPGGGNLLGYEPLVAGLPAGIPVWGLRLPGSDGREEPAATIAELASRFDEAVEARFGAVPVALLGFSTGGLGAYELAQRRRSAGREVPLLALVDTVYPGREGALRAGPREMVAQVRRDGPVALLRVFGAAAGRRLVRQQARFRDRTARRRGSGVSAAVTEQLLYAAMGRAAGRYRPEPYDGRALIVRAGNTEVSLTERPWRALLDDPEVVVVDGSHFGQDEIMRGAPVQRVAAAVAGALSAPRRR